MNLKGIFKQFLAYVASQGIILVQQVLYAPIFIHSYGLAIYGEWLTLSASVAYLGTLNFGVQTFVNNELTIRYNRNEMEEYHLFQSCAMRILLGVSCAAAVLMLAVFFLPVSSALHLSLARSAAASTIYLLGMQIVSSIPLSYFNGAFLVIGRNHRGTQWGNWQRIASVLITAGLAIGHASFVLLAGIQLLVGLCFGAFIIWDFRRLAPQIFPTLRYWNTSIARAILKPSGYFFLIFSCTFLVWQLPVLLMQRLLGPVAVVVFTTMRTIFSMVRQGLTTFTWAIGPEVTRLYSKRDWSGLSRIYSMSEKLLFTLIPTINLGILALSPVLLVVWLHKPNLFTLHTYALMALTSAVVSMKEHKHQFQFSTNRHQEMARLNFFTYVAMVAFSVPLIHRFGIDGFLVIWAATELVQTGYILRLNYKLIDDVAPSVAPATQVSRSGAVENGPVLRLALLTPVVLAAVAALMHRFNFQRLGPEVLFAVCVFAFTFVVSAYAFDLRSVALYGRERWLTRRAATT